jgi:hypothetical protein
MVVDAFIYMFFIGSGTATGVAVVGLITWKVFQRMNNKPKKRGIV